MLILDWLRDRRRRADAEALDRAEATAVETPDEPAQPVSDIDDLRADEEAARLSGEASIEDVERLGDD